MSIAKDIARIKGEEDARRQLKILIIDIETSPHLGYVWSLWQQNVGLPQLVEVSEIICYVAKWYGEKEVIFQSNYHDGHDNMIRDLWSLIDTADVIVHYNGKAFDIKHINREFLLAGLMPPSPYKQIDLMLEIKKYFKFASNKLKHVLEQLGLTEKVDPGGFELWIGCMNNDPESWDQMKTYNLGDTSSTEELYERLRPWITTHPNIFPIENPDEMICPRCGGEDITESGTVMVSMYEYPRYTCNDCGGWLKGRTGQRITNVRSI